MNDRKIMKIPHCVIGNLFFRRKRKQNQSHPQQDLKTDTEPLVKNVNKQLKTAAANIIVVYFNFLTYHYKDKKHYVFVLGLEVVVEYI